MAGRATRSASRKARVTEAVATGPFGALSHDELGVIVDGLADPLQPIVAVALSSTCLGLRTPLQATLEVLKARYERAKALCSTWRMSYTVPASHTHCTCKKLRDSEELNWNCVRLTERDMATFGMLFNVHGLPSLRVLYLARCGLSDTGMQAMCESLSFGALPSLRVLQLGSNQLGPAGAEALAAALRRGALPNLEVLYLSNNSELGNQGMAMLAAPLCKLPTLKALHLFNCEIGDEGVASLVADLGKDDFKALETLNLDYNFVTNEICAMLVTAIKAGAFPSLKDLDVHPCPLTEGPSASRAARESVLAALAARSQ